MGDAKLKRELIRVLHEDASYSENSLFIWTWQGSARMFMMTWLIIGCRNLQHRPFENQYQRMLIPKAQTRRSLRALSLYFFINTLDVHGNMKTLTAILTGILPTYGEIQWICILMWLYRWQNCFFSVSLTSYLFCTGHPHVSERPHPHLRP